MAKFSTGFIFMKCVRVILRNEGGNRIANHPNDPGKLTKYGIATLFYPDLDITNLTEDQAIDIYFSDYWLPMNLFGIHDENLILEIFDFGVNSRSKRYGFNTALKTIQRMVGADVDGVIGPQTTLLINNHINLVPQYKEKRRQYYRNLARRKPSMQVFLTGWLKRVDHCKHLA